MNIFQIGINMIWRVIMINKIHIIEFTKVTEITSITIIIKETDRVFVF
jgi:hypothetical protein